MTVSDIIGQRMLYIFLKHLLYPFLSIIRSARITLFPCSSGYRHVYLEGMEEASIFVHVAINDITGKVTFIRFFSLLRSHLSLSLFLNLDC